MELYWLVRLIQREFEQIVFGNMEVEQLELGRIELVSAIGRISRPMGSTIVAIGMAIELYRPMVVLVVLLVISGKMRWLHRSCRTKQQLLRTKRRRKKNKIFCEILY